MNIEKLKELLELAAMIDGKHEPEPKTIDLDHPMVGESVLVRARNAGVHIGTLIGAAGQGITLGESNRIWSWKGAFTLSEVSQFGIESGRVAAMVPRIWIPINDLGEIIPLTDKAKNLIKANVEL